MPFAVNKKKYKKAVKLLIWLLIAAVSFLYYINVVRPLVLDIAEANVRAAAINSINKAALNIRSFDGFYGEYYNYEKNNEGEIVLITANTASINNMYLFAQKEIQDALNKLNGDTIEVPLGAFSGSAIFSALGPSVSINVSLVGTAEASWHSVYYSKGINQTLHRIILRVTTNMNILIPLKAANVTVQTDIIIAETVILGRVPDSYIEGINEDNIFDLFP